MFLFFEKLCISEGQRYFRQEAKIYPLPINIEKILFGVAAY
jgi:hypothetical protein